MLGFVEFDDQGQLWNSTSQEHDRAASQLKTVLEAVDSQTNGGRDDYLMVVFVHGWHNDAHLGNGNVSSFREALEQLSATEVKIVQKINAQDSAHPVKPRKVIGIYLGWRGESIATPWVNVFTFYDRKNTAQKIGHGEVTEVLARLEQMRQQRIEANPKTRSRLVIVGHSFGGAVVFTALEQILEARLSEAVKNPDEQRPIDGVGNLVVLVNPAFEAQLYAPLRDLSSERLRFIQSQLPVLAVLTSENDTATGFWFPLGRWFSTRFEKERDVLRPNLVTAKDDVMDQHAANVDAVGHFEPYRTHYLKATAPPSGQAGAGTETDENLKLLAAASDAWENDQPGSEIVFPGSTLTRTTTSAGRDPYLVVKVDKALIRDHNDIWRQDIRSFVADLILLASQSNSKEERDEHRHALTQ